MYKAFKGKTVRFLDRIEEIEHYAEPGMLAQIVDIRPDPNDPNEVFILTFDFSQFLDRNREYETNDYFDSDGVPRLNAHQAGFYEEVSKYYFPHPNEVPLEEYFKLEEDIRVAELVEEFKRSEYTDYVAWLEDRLLKTV